MYTGIWRYVEAGSFLVRVRTQESDREKHKAGVTENDPNTRPPTNYTSNTGGETTSHCACTCISYITPTVRLVISEGSKFRALSEFA